MLQTRPLRHEPGDVLLVGLVLGVGLIELIRCGLDVPVRFLRLRWLTISGVTGLQVQLMVNRLDIILADCADACHDDVAPANLLRTDGRRIVIAQKLGDMGADSGCHAGHLFLVHTLSEPVYLVIRLATGPHINDIVAEVVLPAVERWNSYVLVVAAFLERRAERRVCSALVS